MPKTQGNASKKRSSLNSQADLEASQLAALLDLIKEANPTMLKSIAVTQRESLASIIEMREGIGRLVS